MALTREEHLLLIALFVKQSQNIKILLEILKSRDILTGDDSRAFEFSVLQDMPSNDALFREGKAKYIQLAKGLGIPIPPEIEKL